MNSNNNDTTHAGLGRHGRLLPLLALLGAAVLAACSSIDCPMDNLVYTQYQLMRSDGTADTLSDTLTISTNRHDGSDSILINKQTDATTLDLPVSYVQTVDSLFFETKDTVLKQTCIDTVLVEKENKMHFESTDCGVSYFHRLTSVSSTNHRIDSIRIMNPDVNYDTSKKHIYIYFRPVR